MTHQPRQCTARCKDGRRCRSWALRDSVEALCASHSKASRQEPPAEARPPGFYHGAYKVEEAADLLSKTQASNLDDELDVTRVAVRRALLQMRQELDPHQYARLIELVLKGAHTIARIMRAQRSISAGEDELLPIEIEQAIDSVLSRNDHDP